MTDSEMTPPSFSRETNAQVSSAGDRVTQLRPLQGEAAAVVSFDRRELQTILNVYGRQVADGEWRDYALDFTPRKAVFSVFRRASETPLYQIEKNPELARKQGAFSVISATGLVLKRGHDLARVIAVIDRKLKLVEF